LEDSGRLSPDLTKLSLKVAHEHVTNISASQPDEFYRQIAPMSPIYLTITADFATWKHQPEDTRASGQTHCKVPVTLDVKACSVHTEVIGDTHKLMVAHLKTER